MRKTDDYYIFIKKNTNSTSNKSQTEPFHTKLKTHISNTNQRLANPKTNQYHKPDPNPKSYLIPNWSRNE